MFQWLLRERPVTGYHGDHRIRSGQVRPLLVCGGRGLGLLVARSRHLHEELPQLSDVIIKGRDGPLLALLDEIPQTDAVHELDKEQTETVYKAQNPGPDHKTQSKWRLCFLTRTFPSELSCFRGRSGSARVPSGKAWRYKHFPPNGHVPRPWSKYLQAFLLQTQSENYRSASTAATTTWPAQNKTAQWENQNFVQFSPNPSSDWCCDKRERSSYQSDVSV